MIAWLVPSALGLVAWAWFMRESGRSGWGIVRETPFARYVRAAAQVERILVEGFVAMMPAMRAAAEAFRKFQVPLLALQRDLDQQAREQEWRV